MEQIKPLLKQLGFDPDTCIVIIGKKVLEKGVKATTEELQPSKPVEDYIFKDGDTISTAQDLLKPRDKSIKKEKKEKMSFNDLKDIVSSEEPLEEDFDDDLFIKKADIPEFAPQEEAPKLNKDGNLMSILREKRQSEQINESQFALMRKVLFSKETTIGGVLNDLRESFRNALSA